MTFPCHVSFLSKVHFVILLCFRGKKKTHQKSALSIISPPPTQCSWDYGESAERQTWFQDPDQGGGGGVGGGEGGAYHTSVYSLLCHGDSGGCVFTHSADIYGTVLGSGSLSLKPKQVPALLYLTSYCTFTSDKRVKKSFKHENPEDL